MNTFTDALAEFLGFLQDEEDRSWEEDQRERLGAKFTATFGKKYVRIVKQCSSSRSAFCFVDIATGDVLKAATWKAPAKHARGTIYTDSPSATTYGVTLHGATYLS